MNEDSKPVALVTGASRGIGRAIAIELAKTHRVIGTCRGEPVDYAGVKMIRSDVSSGTDREHLFEHVRTAYGRLDLIVNNAGIAPRERRDVLEATEESFDELIATNLKGPHFLTQLAARWMEERGEGRIVFVTSISSYAASFNRAEYCITKAGLSMSAQIYAARLAPKGVLVFELRPGIIRTDMIAAAAASYEERAKDGLLPQRRLGEPEDVARVVRAIADGALDYSAGQIIEVGGGFGLRVL